jgi:hypothetical protein
VISSFVSCSALESITHGALLSIGSLWPFVGEIGMAPFVSFCEYAECYYNKQIAKLIACYNTL